MNWDEFVKIWQESARPQRPVFFRLYHDDQGCPLSYSMEEQPGNYIEVDAQAYLRGSFDVKVVNGQLVEIPRKIHVAKLKPNATGTPCDCQDVTVVVDPHKPNIKWAKI